MPVIITPNVAYGFQPTTAIVDITKKHQSAVGTSIVDVYRSPIERAKQETMTFTGLLNGSEVRLMNATTGIELSGGVESSTTSTITFSYVKPTTTTPVRLLIILAGYKVVSQIYYTGLGNSSQPIFYLTDPAYLA
jgi:hypothetical protein